MNLYDFISDTARRRALADACDTSPDYLWQIATGRRRSSPGLAELIEKESERIGPTRITKESVIFGGRHAA